MLIPAQIPRETSEGIRDRQATVKLRSDVMKPTANVPFLEVSRETHCHGLQYRVPELSHLQTST